MNTIELTERGLFGVKTRADFDPDVVNFYSNDWRENLAFYNSHQPTPLELIDPDGLKTSQRVPVIQQVYYADMDVRDELVGVISIRDFLLDPEQALRCAMAGRHNLPPGCLVVIAPASTGRFLELFPFDVSDLEGHNVRTRQKGGEGSA